MSEAISQFLKTAYSDGKLAALLAHAEDAKLAFYSCCCFAGVPTANHALRAELNTAASIGDEYAINHTEYLDASQWFDMSSAFCALGIDDAERRAKLIPMIKDEMRRRSSLISTQDTCNTKDNDDPLIARSYETENVLV